jgi:transposase
MIPMSSSVQHVGLDVHKKVIAYCVKTKAGRVRDEGTIRATREALSEWVARRKQPWIGAMEATLFTGWVYDHLSPHARQLKVAHPAMLKAIGASKKKNDRLDARTIADLLRVNLLPECHMASKEIREPRRVLRYRHMVLKEAKRMKNNVSGLLMEVGAPYTKRKLHGNRYFAELLVNLEEVPDSVMDLIKISHCSLEIFEEIERRLVNPLKHHPYLNKRVQRLMTIDGVGEIVALTWALEIGDVTRFRTLRQAISYCGLCSAQDSSARKERRGPISKKRNKHFQHVLIETAKIAPQWNEALAQVHTRELNRGNRNRATLAVARKMVAYLMAVDKHHKPYEMRLPAEQQEGTILHKEENRDRLCLSDSPPILAFFDRVNTRMSGIRP